MGDYRACPECKGTGSMDYGMADSMGGPLREACDTCGGEGQIVRASTHRGAVEALGEFQEGLTQALNDHGVPAMPSWREAIDWLAANGGDKDSVSPPVSNMQADTA